MSQNIERIAKWNDRHDVAAFDLVLPVGAHLVAERDGYEHHGIYVGNGQVIHYAGFSRRQRCGPVERISIGCFACGFAVTIQRDASPCYDGEEVARRAGSRLGERNYRLLTNNCEHFCSWCLFGECRSAQVEACLKSPIRAARTLFKLVLVALSSEWRTAQPQARAA
ncbi:MULTISPECIES: lecithin retinol acyltransferase family protein [Ralstonia]|uniref:lecithin retinol acyltransferase family protein n=1 Tax=Ralstonia TaxID=48736 RepID=UPI0020906883|nr:lecithin retinol acyltransferase family protein [Ralstonia mojiangensis]MCO5414838.1 lecithin retinol acyltransferase family protein [Ralstonia mojiangensis]MCT7329398.1 lecithin retinol acyltransferase family protein [Ralstonia mojiangensis]